MNCRPGAGQNFKINMKHQDIKHKGKIIEITHDKVVVEIAASTACEGCHAKHICGSPNDNTRTIPVLRRNNGDFKIGDTVEVMMTPSMGLKAVLIAYVIPCAILLILLLTLPIVWNNELACGLIALGSLAVYYTVLSFFRTKLSTGFVFTVEKPEE